MAFVGTTAAVDDEECAAEALTAAALTLLCLDAFGAMIDTSKLDFPAGFELINRWCILQTCNLFQEIRGNLKVSGVQNT